MLLNMSSFYWLTVFPLNSKTSQVHNRLLSTTVGLDLHWDKCGIVCLQFLLLFIIFGLLLETLNDPLSALCCRQYFGQPIF